MVGLAIHEAVVGVEPALRGPVVLGTAGHVVGRRRVVPLADHDGFVTGGAQRLGQGGGLQRDLAGVAGVARVVVGQPAGAHTVGVAAGEQRRARRRADGVGGVVGEPHTARGQRVDVRGVDLRAVAAGVGPAHVVHEHDDDVRAAFSGFLALRPPGGGLLAGAAYPAAECRVCHGYLLLRFSRPGCAAGPRSRLPSSRPGAPSGAPS